MNLKIYFWATLVLVIICCHVSYASDYETHWAKEEIQRAMQKEIISVDDQFFPNKEITASEIANVFEVFMKKNGLLSSEDHLSVETQNSYFLEKDADACMTREEMAIIVSKVLNLDLDINLESGTSFKDNAEIVEWARGYVAKLQEMKIFVGYPDSSFKPKNHITKAELVTVINRCQDYLGQEVTTVKNRDISGIEIGILKYEDGTAIVSPIPEEIKLTVGESINLSIMLKDDSFDDDLCFEVEDDQVASLDEETYCLEANNIGTTTIAFYLQDGTRVYEFDVIVEE